MSTARRRYLPLLLIPILVIAIGVIGYILIEGWTLDEAFFMTIITLTTVGFGEVRPLSLAGRWFTVVLIVLGVGTVVYSLSLASEYVLMADVGNRLRRRRMENTIRKMKDHIIVIGYGRVGQSAVQALKESATVALVESEPEAVREAMDEGLTVIQGDASDDHILKAAGVERARSLIVCTGDTAANLFIVLSARVLNPDLHIIARSDASSEPKMRRAGANRVVSPYQIGGRHMANIALRPHVTDFLDVVNLDGGVELWMEELTIKAGSALVGRTVGEANVRQQTGATLISILRKDSRKMISPDASTSLEAGDKLIVLGSRKQLTDVQALASEA